MSSTGELSKPIYTCSSCYNKYFLENFGKTRLDKVYKSCKGCRLRAKKIRDDKRNGKKSEPEKKLTSFEENEKRKEQRLKWSNENYIRTPELCVSYEERMEKEILEYSDKKTIENMKEDKWMLVDADICGEGWIGKFLPLSYLNLEDYNEYDERFLDDRTIIGGYDDFVLNDEDKEFCKSFYFWHRHDQGDNVILKKRLDGPNYFGEIWRLKTLESYKYRLDGFF